MSRPIVVESVSALRAQIHAWRREGQRIAMVPTINSDKQIAKRVVRARFNIILILLSWPNDFFWG